jgi:hypothetical protein
MYFRKVPDDLGWPGRELQDGPDMGPTRRIHSYIEKSAGRGHRRRGHEESK